MDESCNSGGRVPAAPGFPFAGIRVRGKFVRIDQQCGITPQPELRRLISLHLGRFGFARLRNGIRCRRGSGPVYRRAREAPDPEGSVPRTRLGPATHLGAELEPRRSAGLNARKIAGEKKSVA